jgi:hypothetical protein
MRKLAGTVVGLLTTATVMLGGTTASAANEAAAAAPPCAGGCPQRPTIVARPLPWEASGHTGSPDGGYQPDGGYHHDAQE